MLLDPERARKHKEVFMGTIATTDSSNRLLICRILIWMAYSWAIYCSDLNRSSTSYTISRRQIRKSWRNIRLTFSKKWWVIRTNWRLSPILKNRDNAIKEALKRRGSSQRRSRRRKHPTGWIGGITALWVILAKLILPFSNQIWIMRGWD